MRLGLWSWLERRHIHSWYVQTGFHLHTGLHNFAALYDPQSQPRCRRCSRVWCFNVSSAITESDPPTFGGIPRAAVFKSPARTTIRTEQRHARVPTSRRVPRHARRGNGSIVESIHRTMGRCEATRTMGRNRRGFRIQCTGSS